MSTTKEKRTKDIVIVKPILYGNYSQHLGKKADESKTHKWTCYVRGINVLEDLSYIKKVVFELHESFPNPKREIVQPPWEVSEVGWGEFEIKIRIFFVDPVEKPVVLTHLLCLYPKNVDPNAAPPAPSKKPLIVEHYEEIIFVNPKPTFYNQLLATFSSHLPSTDNLIQRKNMPYALSVQSLVENNAPSIDEKRDYDLLVKTCQVLDLKINEMNEQLAKKMNSLNKIPL